MLPARKWADALKKARTTDGDPPFVANVKLHSSMMVNNAHRPLPQLKKLSHRHDHTPAIVGTRPLQPTVRDMVPVPVVKLIAGELVFESWKQLAVGQAINLFDLDRMLSSCICMPDNAGDIGTLTRMCCSMTCRATSELADKQWMLLDRVIASAISGGNLAMLRDAHHHHHGNHAALASEVEHSACRASHAEGVVRQA